MSLSQDLIWRGLIKDKTFDDPIWLDKPQKFYLGIDASTDSLTIGNLAVLMLARRLIDGGWQAVLLAGGATSLVGDPGGKDEERELKSHDEIAKNVAGIKAQIEKLFEGKPHEMVNNLNWLDNLKYLDFLRDIGKQYPMSELMQREFVSTRMGEQAAGISYAEFSYSLLQGYDFWWLFKNKQVQMQIGASDQWGNMLSGVPLIRKKEGQQVQAFCMPLVINKATGKKFGKSETGAIWLDPKRTSVTEFYQFWINIDDADAEDYLKIFTVLSRTKIEEIVKQHNLHPEKRLAQTELAKELTELVHGKAALKFSQKVTKYLTGQSPIVEADKPTIEEVKKALTHTTVQPGTPLSEVLVTTGLVNSNSEARRLIIAKAIYINDQAADRDHLESSDFSNGRLMLRRGKAFKDSALIELA